MGWFFSATSIFELCFLGMWVSHSCLSTFDKSVYRFYSDFPHSPNLANKNFLPFLACPPLFPVKGLCRDDLIHWNHVPWSVLFMDLLLTWQNLESFRSQTSCTLCGLLYIGLCSVYIREISPWLGQSGWNGTSRAWVLRYIFQKKRLDMKIHCSLLPDSGCSLTSFFLKLLPPWVPYPDGC